MKPNRRDVLRITGGAAALVWPVLRARAASPAPARLVNFYFPNGAPGFAKETFFPEIKPDGSWNFSDRATSSLAPFQKSLSFHDDVRIQRGEGGAHNPAAVGFLSAAEIVEGEPRGRHNADTPNSHTLDVHVARATGTSLLYLNVKPSRRAVDRISWEGDDRPIPPETDPAAAYEAVFGDFVRLCSGQRKSAGSGAVARRQRLLDLVRGDLKSAPRHFGLGADERAKLERYEQALAEIERQVMTHARRVEALAGSCDRQPPRPSAEVDVPAQARAFGDILVAALALDLRRVATFQLFHPYSDHNYSAWLPVGNKPHHAMTHDKGYPERRRDSLLIVRWQLEQFAYVLGRMRDTPVEAGSLLDNSAFILGTDVPNAFTHDHKEPASVIVGGGRLRGGRHLTGGTLHNAELLATVCRAVGVDNTHFTKLRGFTREATELLV